MIVYLGVNTNDSPAFNQVKDLVLEPDNSCGILFTFYYYFNGTQTRWIDEVVCGRDNTPKEKDDR